MHVRMSRYAGGLGVKTEVNGVELPEVVEVLLSCPADGFPRLSVDMNITEGIDVELDASVEIRLAVFPGYKLEITEANGTKTIRAVREDA